jgi:signal peptidase
LLTPSRFIKFAVNGFAGLAVAGFGLALLAPAVFHVMYVVVLSGSMTPAMPVGSLAVVRSTDPEEVLIGDAITFSSQAYAEVLITHRVVEIVADKSGSPRFRTKGDANEEDDSYLVPGKGVK